MRSSLCFQPGKTRKSCCLKSCQGFASDPGLENPA
jgi:hypothetical protein